MSNAKLTALVLQGGGALGAYEFGVIKALYERADFSPDIVTGVSIGALNAAVMVGGRDGPVETLEKMWQELSLPDIPLIPNFVEEGMAVLGNKAMYHFNPAYVVAPLLATSVYSLGPLRRSLERWVDFDKLNSSSTFVAVTAVNIANGALETFDNRQGLTIEHLLASSSLPPSFPITHINGNDYWDGGLVSNAPLSCAINALEKIDTGREDVATELIVVDLFRNVVEVPNNMIDVIWRSFEILYSSKLKQDLKLFRKINAYIDLLEELSELIPEDSPVRQHPGFKARSRYRKIDHLTVINNNDTGDMGGPASFTKSSVARRIEHGYQDTKAQYETA